MVKPNCILSVFQSPSYRHIKPIKKIIQYIVQIPTVYSIHNEGTWNIQLMLKQWHASGNLKKRQLSMFSNVKFKQSPGVYQRFPFFKIRISSTMFNWLVSRIYWTIHSIIFTVLPSAFFLEKSLPELFITRSHYKIKT